MTKKSNMKFNGVLYYQKRARNNRPVVGYCIIGGILVTLITFGLATTEFSTWCTNVGGMILFVLVWYSAYLIAGDV